MAAHYRIPVGFQSQLVAVLVAALALNYPTQTQISTPPRRTVTIEKRSVVRLLSRTSVTSQDATVGDRIVFGLAVPLAASDGTVVLPAGSLIYGRITKVARARKNCKPGKLAWKFEAARAPDGSTIALRPARGYPMVQKGRLTESQSVGDKIRAVPKQVLATAIVVVFLPFFIAWGKADKGPSPPCNGKPGSDEMLHVGELRYAAVSKNVRVVIPQGRVAQP
ncbi:MAG TPA: hypothetical protein VGR94_05705 [Candidatus Acidoferrales bacterium]|nr:hypothetical protein [Candidatus Acidoferrales bacterium]